MCVRGEECDCRLRCRDQKRVFLQVDAYISQVTVDLGFQLWDFGSRSPKCDGVSVSYPVVVVVRLPRPMEGNGVTQIFRSLQNCQFPHRRLESLEHFNVLYIYIYIILITTVSHFWTLRMPFFLKVSLFVYISICKYTLHVCYVFNVNLTDSFHDRLSMPFDLMIVLHPQTLIPRISN